MTARLAIGDVALSPGAPRVVAAGGETEIDALAAADGADVVELRADLFGDPRPDALPAVLERVRAGGRPAILTVRAAAEGGRLDDDVLRRSLYRAGLAHADAIDVEIASTALVEDVVPRARALGRTVILSAHVLDTTPDAATLHGLVERARALGADVTKVATHARDLDGLRRLIAMTLAERTHGVVTLALGPMGPLSRVVLPAAGSLLTYAHVGRPTAPSGQLALAELAPLVRRLFP
jgi:3-dehydroquinate dehydratase-1